MIRITQLADWKVLRQSWQTPIAFVPTMGNLHEGHLSLVKKAKEYRGKVVVSLYVNPMQFGPTEDFDKYPRTVDADCEKLHALGVDCVLLPNESWLYPTGVQQTAFVEVPTLGQYLCGTSRPTFFKGVATVVLKLFHLVKPSIAVFGEKDYQQSLIVKKIVQDFLLDIEIVTMPIVREADGLAMSSRNQYLTPVERTVAGALYKELVWLSRAIQQYAFSAYPLLIKESQIRLEKLGFEMDYLTLRRSHDLKIPAHSNESDLILLIAAMLGKTRLIDNLSFQKQVEQPIGVKFDAQCIQSTLTID